MKRAIVVPIIATMTLAAALLPGCASTEPIWFIATPGYVESRIMASEAALQADYEEKLATKEAQIRAIESEIEEQRAVSEELAGLADAIREIDASNRELRGIAAAAQDRIEMMPSETLELIIRLLSDYLASHSEPGADANPGTTPTPK